jgi:dTDP-4-amino-4,6-dideoxygalactose transaminase
MKALAGLKQETIHMVDLVGQFSGIESEIRESFDRIFASAAFIGGKEVEQFQQALEGYLDVVHVIPCGNGTDALQIALMALQLEKGDEVIVPAFTFIASVEVIALLGYTPVVCDVESDTFNMNVAQLEELITPRTRAIMPVHLFGQCCNMDAILDIAKKHNLVVVEDNAQSIGAHYTLQSGVTKAAGTMGEIGTTSFYPSKNLGGYGDGGALFTNSPEYGALIKSIANHGMTRRYYHDHVGVNSRLDAFQAVVLNAKLKRLDAYNEVRIAAADSYDAILGGIDQIITPARTPASTHVFHQYTIQVPADKRDALQDHLKAQGIPTMIYYPVPLQNQQAFDGIIKTPVSLDVTTKLCKSVMSLPMHSELTSDQVEFIGSQVRQFFTN